MDPQTVFQLVAVAFAAIFVARHKLRTSKKHEDVLWEAWAEVARRLGLAVQFEQGDRTQLFGMLASSGSLEVRLERLHEDPRTVIRISLSGFAPSRRQLSVVPRSATALVTQALAGTEVKIGAPELERDFSVRGDARYVQAVLDVATRFQLTNLLRGVQLGSRGGLVQVQGSLLQGKLSVEVPYSQAFTSEEIAALMNEVLEPLLDLARRLSEPEDVAARLAANLGVGSDCCEPEAPARLRSLGFLLRDFCDHPAVGQVLELLRDDPSEAVRVEVAIARGEVSQEVLLSWLGHSEASVAVAAAAALGKLGTAAAVPALREVGQRGDRELSRVSRQAIAEIQARLKGAGRGQLSIAAGEGGGLALVVEAEEPGRVSLAEEEELRPAEGRKASEG